VNCIILGRGRLSKCIEQAMGPVEEINSVRVLPSRNIGFNEIKSAVENFNPSHVIDMLDPSSDNLATFKLIFGRNLSTRKYFASQHFPFKYVYISSANVYRPSKDLIYEDSPVQKKISTDYLNLKISSEEILQKSHTKTTILRLPTIWHKNMVADNSNSFFDDLNYAKAKQIRLEYRDGDDRPFSYIESFNAGKLINEYVLDDSAPGLANITSNQWSSRGSLKNNKSYIEENRVGLRVSSHYNTVDLKVT
tara:strand:+ start:1192 stop:1941 length:750 start_codon:yes stop_codon:yes gene_type:complete